MGNGYGDLFMCVYMYIQKYKYIYIYIHSYLGVQHFLCIVKNTLFFVVGVEIIFSPLQNLF